jgi:hypothetical protein
MMIATCEAEHGIVTGLWETGYYVAGLNEEVLFVECAVKQTDGGVHRGLAKTGHIPSLLLAL